MFKDGNVPVIVPGKTYKFDVKVDEWLNSHGNKCRSLTAWKHEEFNGGNIPAPSESEHVISKDVPLAEAVNKGEMYLETESHKESIIQELEYVKMYDMDKDNKLKILPKEKVKEHIGRSQDFSDSMAMRMYFEVKPKSSFG